MQSKGSFSLIMMIAIGLMSVITPIAGHKTESDLDGRDELALTMAGAAEQELTAKEMDGKHICIIVTAYYMIISVFIVSYITGKEILYVTSILFPDVNCIDKYGWSTDLTLRGLKEMMLTFLGVRWGSTYIFAPKCPKLATQGHVYVSGSRNHAEDNMAAKCGLPTEFYLTSATCPDCAMMLYNKYKTETYKPFIYIARPYQGKGKEGSEGNKEVNLHCLAMLMEVGFTILPWDWEDFGKYYITNDECKKAINEMTTGDMYKMRINKAIEAIEKAVKMKTGNHDLNYSPCSKAAKNGK